MSAKGQFSVFCICLAVGFVGGVLYEFFLLFRLVFRCGKGKNKIVGVVLDILYCLSFAVLCTYASYRCRFPNLRAFMWIGYVLGWIIYLKSLRRILAFLQNVCYNKATKLAKRLKTKKKLSKTGDKI